MAVNKVIYDGETLMDLTGDTVREDTLLAGYTAHDATGNPITGTMVVPPVLTGISIMIPPTKTVYMTGEHFDPSGMVVRAIYSNGATGIVTGFLYAPAGELEEGNTSITVSYMEAGTTVTATLAITVKGYDAVFANNTWEQIIAACQKNKVPSAWVAGNSKSMTINGKDYQIDIIGKNHDTYSDGSGVAPLTFQMHNCYDTQYAMNDTATNVGGWESSKMRTTHLPAILSLMPSEVRVAVKEVNKKTSAGNKSATINTTRDKLFLLSEWETFGNSQYGYTVAGEGTQYAYYQAGNSKMKTANGAGGNWWGRSPVKTSVNPFWCASEWGMSHYIHANAAAGVAFAFCF